jgi:hypothetical protein
MLMVINRSGEKIIRDLIKKARQIENLGQEAQAERKK